MNETTRYTSTNLQEILRTQGRSQTWIAQQVGLSKDMMSKVVRGKRSLDESTASHIAQLLGVSLFLAFELRLRSEAISEAEQERIPA